MTRTSFDGARPFEDVRNFRPKVGGRLFWTRKDVQVEQGGKRRSINLGDWHLLSTLYPRQAHARYKHAQELADGEGLVVSVNDDLVEALVRCGGVFKLMGLSPKSLLFGAVRQEAKPAAQVIQNGCRSWLFPRQEGALFIAELAARAFQVDINPSLPPPWSVEEDQTSGFYCPQVTVVPPRNWDTATLIDAMAKQPKPDGNTSLCLNGKKRSPAAIAILPSPPLFRIGRVVFGPLGDPVGIWDEHGFHRCTPHEARIASA